MSKLIAKSKHFFLRTFFFFLYLLITTTFEKAQTLLTHTQAKSKSKNTTIKCLVHVCECVFGLCCLMGRCFVVAVSKSLNEQQPQTLIWSVFSVFFHQQNACYAQIKECRYIIITTTQYFIYIYTRILLTAVRHKQISIQVTQTSSDVVVSKYTQQTQ